MRGRAGALPPRAPGRLRLGAALGWSEAEALSSGVKREASSHRPRKDQPAPLGVLPPPLLRGRGCRARGTPSHRFLSTHLRSIPLASRWHNLADEPLPSPLAAEISSSFSRKQFNKQILIGTTFFYYSIINTFYLAAISAPCTHPRIQKAAKLPQKSVLLSLKHSLKVKLSDVSLFNSP